MEKLLKYLIRNLVLAGKRVLRRIFEYLPFLVALFVIETMLLTLYITNDTDRNNRYERIRETYDYDILIDGLTSSQSTAIENRLYIQSHANKRLFESYRVERSKELNDRYQIYVLMRDGASNEDFLDYYVYQNSGVYNKETINVSFTPLNEYRGNTAQNRGEPSVWLLLVIGVLSAASLAALYTVRIDQNRFEYGIYMSFGAGAKRLITASVFEMLIVSVIALVPSALFSVGLSSFVYSQYDIKASFDAFMLIKVLLIGVLVTIAGVYLPMKIMSKRMPMSMIVGADNSNLVTPPRFTRFITGKRFFERYELMSIWRFRKYYLRLLLSATLFAAVFICGVYICNMNAEALDEDVLQYEISFRDGKTSDGEREEILENIRNEVLASGDNAYLYYAAEDYAGSSLSLMLINRGAVRIQGDDVAVLDSAENPFPDSDAALDGLIDEGFDRATFKYVYKAYDKEMLAELEARYEIVGDVYSVLNNENTVIVSEDALNTRKYRFEVGDTIVFARFVEEGESELDPGDESYYLYADEVATSLLNTNRYEFVEYTVGAVIKGCPESEGYVSAILSKENYTHLTGVSAVPTSAEVYLEGDADDEDASLLEKKVTDVCSNYNRALSVSTTYGYLYRVIERERAAYSFGIALSLLILAMMPIVWFYSQSLYYEKREKELLVLRAYGATDALVKRIFMTSGAMLSAIGFVFTMIVGLLSSFVIFKVMNEWIVALGFGQNIRFTFDVSWWALLLCLIISAVSGFLSCYLPYRKNIAKIKRNR